MAERLDFRVDDSTWLNLRPAEISLGTRPRWEDYPSYVSSAEFGPEIAAAFADGRWVEFRVGPQRLEFTARVESLAVYGNRVRFHSEVPLDA